MDVAGLRNFKDFLQIYNQMAEVCFNRCVSSISGCTLSNEEETCVKKCASKHININHKMMAIYMEVQPQMINKRNEEMAQQQREQEAKISAIQAQESDLKASTSQIQNSDLKVNTVQEQETNSKISTVEIIPDSTLPPE